MKKLLSLILLVSSCILNVCGQITDNSIEQIMTKRLLDCDEIGFNAVNLIPKLYRENKIDTLEAVIGYWRRNCGMPEPLVSFSILYAIKNHNFKEELRYNKGEFTIDSSLIPDNDFYATNIISYLQWYYSGFDIRRHPKIYTSGFYKDYLVANYSNYYDFLVSMALSLCSRKDLTPAENFLVHYFAHPDPSILSQLATQPYDSTVLQAAYFKSRAKGNKISGFQIALTGGIWVPQGNLSLIGNHPYLGFTIGGRTNKLMYDINFSARFLNSPNPYHVLNNDTLVTSSYYDGIYFGMDWGYQVFRKKKHEIDILFGLAVDVFDANYGNPNLNSLNLNAGLGYKIYLKHIEKKNMERFPYIAFQAKHNFINYNNSGGTDVTGNAFTFGVLYGLYRRAIRYNYNPSTF